jgi:hypothetical protein
LLNGQISFLSRLIVLILFAGSHSCIVIIVMPPDFLNGLSDCAFVGGTLTERATPTITAFELSPMRVAF